MAHSSLINRSLSYWNLVLMKRILRRVLPIKWYTRNLQNLKNISVELHVFWDNSNYKWQHRQIYILMVFSVVPPKNLILRGATSWRKVLSNGSCKVQLVVEKICASSWLKTNSRFCSWSRFQLNGEAIYSTIHIKHCCYDSYIQIHY